MAKNELTVIPSKSFIFIGLESEWQEIIKDSKTRSCNALLLKNDNTLEVKKLVWCDERITLFVSPEKKNSFNIDDYSDNYNIYVSDSITPLSNKTKDLIKKEKREKRIERERQELDLKKLKNAKVISLEELSQTKSNNKLSAINFKEGTNFQRQLIQGKGCHGLNHDLHLVVGILHDKNGVKTRVGKVFVCTTCGRTYLGSSTNKTINLSDFPRYSFNDWPETNEEINDKKQNGKTGNIEEDINEIIEQQIKQRFATKAEKDRQVYFHRYPQKNNDVVLIDENVTVFLGDDLIHKTNDHKLITCKVGILKNGKSRYEYYKKTQYCPVCKKYYLFPAYTIKRLKQKHSYNQFEEGSWYKEQLKKEKIRIEKEQEAKKIRKLELYNKKIEEQKKKETENTSQTEVPIRATNIGAKDFLVRTTSFSCRKNGHKYKEITACVTVILSRNRFQEIYLPGWYCEKCKCYYISENDFERIDRIGAIVAQVYSEKEWREKGRAYRSFSDLSEESILHKLGYNVNAADNLSDAVRQDILASAVDFNLITRREVIDFLTWMINTRSNNDRMQTAIGKWETDLRFISDYKLNSREYVKVKSLTIKRHGV